ncbi:hypothetical protein [Aquabacterium sp.]|uniref:hypothetical protein n=1 Tax=Aquabacterium sp. TaxID=1872578 RepID=UPI002BF113D8|nr:hypothetical protein [Aquabacterium sp.]HSW09211.1 hypothetical protein [Aquabacterium sp.]
MADRSGDSVRAARGSPLRQVLDATLPWVLVVSVGIGFLGGVLQRGLAARPGLAAPGALPLAALKTRLESEAGATSGPQLQRHLEEALAQAPSLQAIDWVADDGRVRASTEPTAVGRPADEGPTATGARVPLLDAAGRPLGLLVAHAIEHAGTAADADGARLPLVTLALALVLPLLSLVLVSALGNRAPVSDERVQARRRLSATRQRLGRAAQEIEWLEASGAAPHTGVFTRTGATLERRR